jgi:hypothetical protein
MATMRQVIQTALRAGAFCALTHGAFRDLADELGGPEHAAAWLVEQATRNHTPIALNLATTTDPAGPSRTICLSPRGWSEERLRGWIAGRHRELETAFGKTAGARPWRR